MPFPTTFEFFGFHYLRVPFKPISYKAKMNVVFRFKKKIGNILKFYIGNNKPRAAFFFDLSQSTGNEVFSMFKMTARKSIMPSAMRTFSFAK